MGAGCCKATVCWECCKPQDGHSKRKRIKWKKRPDKSKLSRLEIKSVQEVWKLAYSSGRLMHMMTRDIDSQITLLARFELAIPPETKVFSDYIDMLSTMSNSNLIVWAANFEPSSQTKVKVVRRNSLGKPNGEKRFSSFKTTKGLHKHTIKEYEDEKILDKVRDLTRTHSKTLTTSSVTQVMKLNDKTRTLSHPPSSSVKPSKRSLDHQNNAIPAFVREMNEFVGGKEKQDRIGNPVSISSVPQTTKLEPGSPRLPRLVLRSPSVSLNKRIIRTIKSTVSPRSDPSNTTRVTATNDNKSPKVPHLTTIRDHSRHARRKTLHTTASDEIAQNVAPHFTEHLTMIAESISHLIQVLCSPDDFQECIDEMRKVHRPLEFVEPVQYQQFFDIMDSAILDTLGVRMYRRKARRSMQRFFQIVYFQLLSDQGMRRKSSGEMSGVFKDDVRTTR